MLYISEACDEEVDWHSTWAKQPVWATQLALDQVACIISTLSAIDYYSRLCHSPLSVLKLIIPSLGHIFSSKCESCQLGKHYNASDHSRGNKQASTPYDLVHSDVWDPCPITFKLGFKYLVGFEDDHSRVTWIHLLKSPTEALCLLKFSCFLPLKFRNNHFNSNIKILRSIMQKDIWKFIFATFFARNDVLHPSSCVYTQQNGVVKQKKRHLLDIARRLLDIARTVLFHSQVPQKNLR